MLGLRPGTGALRGAAAAQRSEAREFRLYDRVTSYLACRAVVSRPRALQPCDTIAAFVLFSRRVVPVRKIGIN